MSRAARLSPRIPSLLVPLLLLALGALFLSCAGGGKDAAPEAESEAIAEPAGPTPLEVIAAAVAHPDRLEGDLARDADRRPAGVLAFFGIEAGQRVAEIMAAGGYYTELLARVVGPEGAVYAQVFAALKPGGVYGVVDHHAEAGSKDRDVEKLHRVDGEMVKEEILAAGFVLDAESDALAHPEDTRDWNIFENDVARRDQTDRFIYRFRKPG